VAPRLHDWQARLRGRALADLGTDNGRVHPSRRAPSTKVASWQSKLLVTFRTHWEIRSVSARSVICGSTSGSISAECHFGLDLGAWGRRLRLLHPRNRGSVGGCLRHPRECCFLPNRAVSRARFHARVGPDSTRAVRRIDSCGRLAADLLRRRSWPHESESPGTWSREESAALADGTSAQDHVLIPVGAPPQRRAEIQVALGEEYALLALDPRQVAVRGFLPHLDIPLVEKRV